jgi:CRISPR-associated endonuclease/helicase Cas3
MTATPAGGLKALSLDSSDWEHKKLKPRLHAEKHARLERVSTKAPTKQQSWVEQRQQDAENRAAIEDKVVAEATRLAGVDEESSDDMSRLVVGVVVNRVASARAVFGRLRELTGSDGEPLAHTILLTGRVREHDRDHLLYEAEVEGREGGWIRYIRATRADEDQLSKPLFVVATQTVEVGADLSFDALVTELASLDALRQRFGRLDRLGDNGVSYAAVVAGKHSLQQSSEDPIYGQSLRPTWGALNDWSEQSGRGRNKVVSVNFGLATMEPRIGELREADPSALDATLAPRRDAPVLLPVHVDTLCQTSPAPAPEPDLSLWLHGPETGSPDVQIVWRADLPTSLGEVPESDLIDTIGLVPPTSPETITIPLHHAADWLRGKASGEPLTDVEGACRDRPSGQANGQRGAPAVRWAGPDDSASGLVRAADLRPGDTIVVPSSYGGIDAFGWHPESREPVSDIAEAAYRTARRKPALRIHPHIDDAWIPELLDAEDDPPQSSPGFEVLLRTLRDGDNVTPRIKQAATELLQVGWRRSAPYPGDAGWALIGRRRLSREQVLDAVGEETASGDTASMLGGEVELGKHCRDVRTRVEAFVGALGFAGNSQVANELTIAALLHDAGKADPRFQTWLHGGDEIASALASELLAKSDTNGNDRLTIRRARERAGYPAGARHEALSVAMLRSAATEHLNCHNLERVAYLIGVHHGRGRPFMPPVPDEAPVQVELELAGISMASSSDHRLHHLGEGWPDLFWQMVRRHGPWGIAWLEGLVTLADRQVSREEEDAAAEAVDYGEAV